MQLPQLTRATLLLTALLPLALNAQSYIGFVYPAGGQQGTTVKCTAGGQSLADIRGVTVSGSGVKGCLVEYNKRMNPQEVQLLREQLRELRAMPTNQRTPTITNMMARITHLVDNYVQQPQCASIANIAVIEVTIAPDATPGEREIRLYTERGLTNPMPFYVGQLPEYSGEPLPTSTKPILGKEGQSLRRQKRRATKLTQQVEIVPMTTSIAGPGVRSELDDEEMTVTIPCTLNGQIASGSVDRFRFKAKRGQKLVITTLARALVPYLADAVPGWFQPVLTLCDAHGTEVAYNDDYRFKPDPVILFEVPTTGEYILAIHDAIFRGREDFVYRISLGELPFVTGVFPLGSQTNLPTVVDLKGFHLTTHQLIPDITTAVPGIYALNTYGRDKLAAPPTPFALDRWPDAIESEPNNTPRQAQSITPPLVMNGTIGYPGDVDHFRFKGRAGQEIVAEVFARRLDSPVDSLLQLLDSQGTMLACNDDFEDLGSGLNTHHADSYLRLLLPHTDTYTLLLSDTQHKGGSAYAYRLHLGSPRPDFELRIVPSRVVMSAQGAATVSVHLLRKDDINVPIRLTLKNPAICGFALSGQTTLSGTQSVTRVTISTTLKQTPTPVTLQIEGFTTYAGQELSVLAVPAEDRMQAFLWRHLVPAQEFLAYVYPKP